jgi:hypothetical protein
LNAHSPADPPRTAFAFGVLPEIQPEFLAEARLGDWIKMRTDLYSDPKACVLADCLMNERGPLATYVSQHCQRDMTVTRNVMRHVTVGALVKVWGVMRFSGKRVGDDLVRERVALRILDDVTDLPGFGEAMREAGWVREDANSLIFPNFFEEHNVDPSELQRRKNAERQQRHRDRYASRDNNVTEPAREEKRREDSNTLSLLTEPISQDQSQKHNAGKFVKPSIEEVRGEVIARDMKLDPETFWHFHESKGWKIGAQPMKNWKSALVTWEKREAGDKRKRSGVAPGVNGVDLKRQAVERLNR